MRPEIDSVSECLNVLGYGSKCLKNRSRIDFLKCFLQGREGGERRTFRALVEVLEVLLRGLSRNAMKARGLAAAVHALSHKPLHDADQLGNLKRDGERGKKID